MAAWPSGQAPTTFAPAGDPRLLEAADRMLSALSGRWTVPPKRREEWEAQAQLVSAASMHRALQGGAGPLLADFTADQLTAASPTDVVDASSRSIAAAMADFSRAVGSQDPAVRKDPAEAAEDFVKALDRNIGTLDSKIATTGQQLDDVLALAGRLYDVDPQRAMRLLALAEQLEYGLVQLRKEKEKQEELRSLIILLTIGGFLPKGLIDKLRAMGLGPIVDMLLTFLLPRGRLSKAMVEVLQEAGYAGMVAMDDARLKELDRVRTGTDRFGRPIPQPPDDVDRAAAAQVRGGQRLTADGRLAPAAAADAGQGLRLERILSLVPSGQNAQLPS